MKIMCNQNRSAAIAAGIEPAINGKIEVEVTLAELSPEQRACLAELLPVFASDTPIVIAGTQSEVIEWLDERIARKAQQSAQAAKQQADAIASTEAWIASAALIEGTAMASGVQYTSYRVANMPLCFCPDGEIKTRAIALRNELHAEAIRLTDESRASIQPLIDAADAAAKERAEAAAAERAAAISAAAAERLATGIIKISISRGDRDRWGEPWIAKSTARNGRKPEYDFSAGAYDLATETLTIPCAPGEIVAWGQKNYRKPKATIHEVRLMKPDGSLVSA